MASLSLKHISKIYDGTTLAVKDFNMDIQDREFIVFVGPSGCGKSTTLRMIAGLEDISAGELTIGGTVVNDLEPRDRGIAMVFQNYALYPHMTVYENMAFSLRTAKVKKEVIHKKVMEAAEALGITEYLSRKPKALSGGQRQRVALGRAIVREPKVFLFDEPLSNLDAKLRASMRAEIIRLWERLGTTFIYVTHDQVEAMTMGSRIVVMKDGVVRQIDTPTQLYRHPADLFVAGFIGTPRMNILPVTLTREENSSSVILHLTGTEHTLRVPFEHLDRLPARYMPPATQSERAPALLLGVRPEDLHLLPGDACPIGGESLPLRVSVVENLGGESLVYATVAEESICGGGKATTTSGDEPDADRSASASKQRNAIEVIFKTDADSTLARGDNAMVAIDPARLHIFDPETEKSLLPPVPQTVSIPCVLSKDTLTVAGHSIPLPPALQDDNRPTTDEELTIPSDALRVHPNDTPHALPAKLLSAAPLDEDGRHLCRCALGSQVLYVVSPLPEGTKPGDLLALVPDLSRLSLPHVGINPPPTKNSLPGRLLRREKRLVRAGASPFALEMGEHTVTADPDLLSRLFAIRGTAILRADLLFEIPFDAVTITNQAASEDTDDLPARVEQILDYSPGPTLLRLSVGAGHTLLCRMPPENARQVGDRIALRIDTSRLTVLDRATEPPTVIV